MMTRTEAFEYLAHNYYVDKQTDEVFNELMHALINTPHKPWCRTRARHSMPNYGSECTCNEGDYLNCPDCLGYGYLKKKTQECATCVGSGHL